MYLRHWTNKGTNMKKTDKSLKYKGKPYKVKELAKKLNITSNIQISRRKTWFSEAMSELDKKGKE